MFKTIIQNRGVDMMSNKLAVWHARTILRNISTSALSGCICKLDTVAICKRQFATIHATEKKRYTTKESVREEDRIGQNAVGNHKKENLPESHWLGKMIPSWQNTKDLHEQLNQRIFYEDDHMIALDKPVKLPNSSHDDNCIKSFLKPLQLDRKSEVMQRVFSPNRCCSGVVILAKTKRAVEVLSKYFTHCQASSVFFQKYRIITVGVPVPLNCSDVIGVDLKYMTDGHYNVTVHSNLTKLPGKIKREHKASRSAVVPINMKTLHSKSLDASSSVALVELEARKVKWDALQVYLLHKFCPALGDHMYSGCLKYVLGQPVIMKHTKHNHMNAIQNLPTSIMELLNLQSTSQIAHLPLLMHCDRLELPKVHAIRGHLKSEKIITQSPTPSYFTETLSRLGLHYNEE